MFPTSELVLKKKIPKDYLRMKAGKVIYNLIVSLVNPLGVKCQYEDFEAAKLRDVYSFIISQKILLIQSF